MRCTITREQQFVNIEISEHREFSAAISAIAYAPGKISMDTKMKGVAEKTVQDRNKPELA